ncbi:SanA/YdcF family protein [Phormidium sp. CCY1219]|uniref:SanA/YdcF family protein n=1 Tax=Phormidium sp. CCY1219 TaxID=2886104 RepID=UPI002D1F6B00|nr:ElyC/SanA/YdcF family protein [Phormidium sp. CCY1219]MEB3831221.1 YdcF family protein [Phormidium sp. CCY1219]
MKLLILHPWFFNWRFILLLLAVSVPLIPVALNYYVYSATQPYRYSDRDRVTPQPIAIVLGAGVWEDGTPTPMLADRIQAAVDLYKRGRVQKILMTGDNSTPHYNEVAAMQNYAEKRGVPVTDITLDYAGFSTYESCYRAKEIFGIQQAILITQRYHLPRAVYTCRQMGVDAIGLGTPDWGVFRNDSMRYYILREILAVVKALWEIHITRPRPTFLGPFEGIS